jgi:hypothetical protein
MSEFNTLLTRIDAVALDVVAVRDTLTAHCAAEEATKVACANVDGKRSKWVDRAWTLGVCLAGVAAGFLFRKF